jgi:integrase
MTTHKILGGKVSVYKRPTGEHWHCAASVNGRQFRVSTREVGLPEAKEAAEDWYLSLRAKARAGVLKTEKTFQEAAEQFLREYEIITAGQRSPAWVKGHGIRLRLHLLPFFGNSALSEITAGKVQEYRVERMTQSKSKPVAKANGNADHKLDSKPKPPARSTLHDEIVTLRQVLKTATRHNWLKHLPDLSPPYKTQGKIVHRPWFSPEEYKKLYNATREYARQPAKERYRWNAEQVHDYVLFLANTGLRPDEAKNLQHRDVTMVKDDATGELILEIDVRGKRGVGFCKSTPSAVKPYQRLLNRGKWEPQGRKPRSARARAAQPEPPPLKKPEPTDPVFPGNHIKLFNGVLARSGLKLDRDGNRRTAYSLRHTYICMRLMEGADIYQIAKNCRTSVEMIEKFYAAHIKNTLDAAAINVRKPRKRPSVSDGSRMD